MAGNAVLAQGLSEAHARRALSLLDTAQGDALAAGKTTLANLVPCFYRPTSGRILLDGHDLATVKLASLRANIALVSQDVVLFNDTVAANIAYGVMRDTDEAEIVKAAEAEGFVLKRRSLNKAPFYFSRLLAFERNRA